MLNSRAGAEVNFWLVRSWSEPTKDYGPFKTADDAYAFARRLEAAGDRPTVSELRGRIIEPIAPSEYDIVGAMTERAKGSAP